MPKYLLISEKGWQEKIDRGLSLLDECTVCPNNCRVNRVKGEQGKCRSGFFMKIASAFAHRGEEPVISGTRGSGTIFFSGCTLSCNYCQNYPISQNNVGLDVPFEKAAEYMLELQRSGCHNINLVTPTHFIPQIVIALELAVKGGLRIPIVYNTSGYESEDALHLLDGLVDIYLPDMRYGASDAAKKYSGVNDYVTHNRRAVSIMADQVGELVVDEGGIAQQGLIVRLLILPDMLDGLKDTLRFLAYELPITPHVSLMSQYFPTWKALNDEHLSRAITKDEYAEAVSYLHKYGLDNGWVQDL